MNLIVVAVALLAISPAALFFINLRRYRAPPRLTQGAQPSIAVLIPARDEERVIRTAVESALASTGVDLEVRVLDDHSEDRTAAIVLELAARDPRVHLVRAPPLPPGWNGKQHACDLLAKNTRRPILVFIDADVRLAPDGLAKMTAFLEASGADLISGIPRQEVVSLGERLVVPLIHFALLAFLPMGRMRRSRHPAYAAGIGQLFMARQSAYRACGGHAAIRATRHDGLMLPRTFRANGFATDLFDATRVATCRMYRSTTEVWAGFAKNADEGLARPTSIFPATVLLLGGQVAPFVLLPIAHNSILAAIVVAGMLAAYAPRIAGAVRFLQPWSGALLHPLGIVMLVAIQWYALYCKVRGRPVAWKKRAPAGELEAET